MFPLAPDQIIVQMWPNGVQSVGELKTHWFKQPACISEN